MHLVERNASKLSKFNSMPWSENNGKISWTNCVTSSVGYPVVDPQILTSAGFTPPICWWLSAGCWMGTGAYHFSRTAFWACKHSLWQFWVAQSGCDLGEFTTEHIFKKIITSKSWNSSALENGTDGEYLLCGHNQFTHSFLMTGDSLIGAFNSVSTTHVGSGGKQESL